MNRSLIFPVALFGCVALLAQPSAAQIQPVSPRPKPQHYEVPAGWETRIITVKFRDGLNVRLRDGALTDLGSGALADAERTLELARGGIWSRTHTLPEEEIDRLRELGERNVGFPLHDLNLQFRCLLPIDVDASRIIDALNALPAVEMAEAIPGFAPLPSGNDHRDEQGYLQPAPRGVGAGSAWGLRGGACCVAAPAGIYSRICDIEYGYDPYHDEFQSTPFAFVNQPGYSDPSFDEHGTAVLGMLFGKNDSVGISGMTHAAPAFFGFARTQPYTDPFGQIHPYGDYVVDAAISSSTSMLGQGGVILLEQQMFKDYVHGTGPLLPVEWHGPTYQAIRNAVAAGLLVVEAAANSGQNLDDATFVNDPLAPHNPFLPANDSGAILVGAGASPVGSSTDRSRLSFSNFGSTVDLQGWGENVVTSGYGDLYLPGSQLRLTAVFSGTSSASPIVAGACAILQSMNFDRHQTYLSPAQIRSALISTGSLQQSGANPSSEHIGPRPDVMKALVALGLFNDADFAQGFRNPGTGNHLGDLGPGGIVNCMAMFDDDGPGPRPPALYIGGDFMGGGGMMIGYIARWNGGSWSAVGVQSAQYSVFDQPVRALAVHDPDGNGPLPPCLFAGGDFSWVNFVPTHGLAKFDGTSWSTVDGGVNGPTGGVRSLQSFDEDGAGPLPPTLFVGGEFLTVGNSNLSAPHIARWRNGTWMSAGNGFNGTVRSFVVFDRDNQAPAAPVLVAGGDFTASGATTARHIATWNNNTWSEFGGGTNGTVRAMVAWPSPDLPIQNLYIGGDFTSVGSQSASFIAEWLGGISNYWANFAAAGIPINGPVHAMTVCDDGFFSSNEHVYPTIYVGGEIHDPANAAARTLLRFVGGYLAWDARGSFDGPIEALMGVDDDGAGNQTSDVYIGGIYSYGPNDSAGLAKVFGKPRGVLTYCSGKQNSLGCTPRIDFGGNSSASMPGGFTVQAHDLLNNKAGLLLYSLTGRASLPFLGGTLCLQAPLKRSTNLFSGGTPSPVLDCSGMFMIDMNAFASGLLGGNPAPGLRTVGQTVNCQFWGRDPGFAAPNNSMLSSALEYVVGP